MASNTATFFDRNIIAFRNQLVGGGARPNLFECYMGFPSYLNLTGVEEKASFMIKSASLPASTVNSLPIQFRGRTLKISGDRTYDPWTITVLNDTDFVIRGAFERWLDSVNKFDSNSGVITPALYQTDNMVVRQLGRGTKNTTKEPALTDNIKEHRTYKFYGAFPTSVSEIALSYDDTDQIETYTVTIDYQYWEAFDTND